MRKVLLVISVLFAVPLFAQQDPSKLQLSVFATDPTYVQYSSGDSNFTMGLGAALEYRWNQQWAIELQAATQHHVRSEDSYPIDLLVHYRFQNASRWKPFLGAGVRYERSSSLRYDRREGPEIDGGVNFMITPALSLRLDAKATMFFMRGGQSEFAVRPLIGFGWKF